MEKTQEPKKLGAKIIYRLGVLKDMIVKTPHYPWIMLLSLVSGVFSFVGFPLLIPILEYLQVGELSGSNNQVLASIEQAIRNVGIEPTFYSMLAIASVTILLGELLVVFSSLIALYASFTLIKEYSRKLFQAYLKVNWDWLSSTNSGEINYVVLKEAEMAATCHLYAQRLIISFVQCCVYAYIAILMSAKSVMMACVIYGGLTLLNYKNARAIRRITTGVNQLIKKMSGELSGLQQNKKFLKTSLLNQSVVDRTLDGINNINDGYKRVGLRIQMQQGWNFAFLFIFLIMLILFRNQLGINYASLLVLVLVFNRLSPQFNLLSSTYASMNNYLPMYYSIKDRLAEMHTNLERQGGEDFKTGSIRFEDVRFAYPHGPEVIKGLNMKIDAYKSVAIVGSSGAGKTTILDLVLGLLQPKSGKIYYGDVAHDRVDLDSLRRSIAYISQEPTLMDGTIRDNLTIGCPQATEEMIQSICKKVHIDQFIANLPDGLETKVGENGIKLSGGQRQRIVLGRSLFMNPKVLILDEATSELDSESEHMIQQTIRELSEKLTIIIVAHRLSTVKIADTIYVLESGQVVESGSYNDLLEQKGRFHQFTTLQT